MDIFATSSFFIIEEITSPYIVIASIPNDKQKLYSLDYRSIIGTRADLSHQMGTRGKYFASSSAVLRNEIIYVRCQNGPLSYIQFFSGYYAHCFEMDKIVQKVIYILKRGNDFLIAQSICTHDSCFESMGWIVTLKKCPKYGLQKVGCKKKGSLLF